MGHHKHRSNAPQSIRVAVLSISSTRDLQTDTAGKWITKRAGKEGHQLVGHQVVDDDSDAIREALLHLLADAAPQAVIVTGGTGITPKDVTIEAVRPLFTKELTAFGPIFAQLSFEEIDSAAILSRATAGVISECIVFCIPGSLKACKLACKALIFPEIGHACGHVGTH